MSSSQTTSVVPTGVRNRGTKDKSQCLQVKNMPRKIQDKELNDMRRIIEILLEHPTGAHKRMIDYIIGAVEYFTEEK